MQAPDDDEGITDIVVGLVQTEVKEEIKRLKGQVGVRGNAKRPGGGKGMVRCPFCPYRAFQNRKRVLDHISQYHTKDRLFIASGRSEFQ